MSSVPAFISDITDADSVRVQLYASNTPVHAPLTAAVAAGGQGKFIPPGGDEGQVLTKASDDDYDVVWSSSIGLRAFANIDGTTSAAAIREGQNVSGVVENATGDYTLSFTESVSSTAAITITAGDTGTPGLYAANIVEITTTSVRFQIRDAAGDPIAADTICVIVAGVQSSFLLTSGDEQDSGADKIELTGDEQPGVEKLSGE